MSFEGLSSVPIMIDILLWFVWLKYKMIVIFVAIKRLEADVATMNISIEFSEQNDKINLKYKLQCENRPKWMREWNVVECSRVTVLGE